MPKFVDDTEYNSLFIVFEGGEGSGKSTQAALLGEAFDELKIPYCLTREPGDTDLGKELRNILLKHRDVDISQNAEALLFAADRAEHVQKVIYPALYRGEVVICDRYIASTVAYQSYGGGLPVEKIQTFSDWASDYLYPDVTFYLDIDPLVGLKRAGQANRFEDKDILYHMRVRDGFMQQMARDPSWVRLDATRPMYDLHTFVRLHVMYMYKMKMTQPVLPSMPKESWRTKFPGMRHFGD